jgi:metallo-beta-lactamase class B
VKVTNSITVLSGSYYTAGGHNELLGEVYGIKTGDSLILVDCGAPGNALSRIKETLEYYGETAPITHVLLTHAHYDHCGNAKALQDQGAKIIVGKPDAFQCSNGGPHGLETPFDTTEFAFPAFQPDIEITEDCEMELNSLLFRFIQIPGHTPGSMAISLHIDKKDVLFTGDALWPLGDSVFGDVSFGFTGDLGYSRADTVSSMMKLRKTQADILLPGHGKICLANGTGMLDLAASKAFMTLR